MSKPIRNAVTLVVDGREVVAPEGTMLVDAAKGGDVEIPVFCYEPKLGEPVGACRMCLVEIEGIPKLQTACSTPVRDGMVVYTQTEQVQEAQNAVVEFLLVNHPLDCPVCDKGGECPLQDIAMGWGPGKSRMHDPKRHFQKPLELSPLVAIDRERCILCYRCVRFSQEVAEDEQLQLLERGDRSYVGTYDDRPYVAPFHGNIIELCPVGALTSYTYRFRARPWDIEDAGSVCTLCPSQCNVKFTVRDENVMRVNSRDNHDVDDGWLCDKGRFGYQMLAAEDRIVEPMVRGGDGTLSPVSWEEALKKIADGLKAAGPNAAALLGGGASNEEGWLTQRILRTSLGSQNVASSANPIDPAVAGELARPELTARTPDIDFAGAILVAGCDPLNESPILDLRIRKAVRRGGAKLLVATERPSALDGGAHEAARFAPGEAGAFFGAVAGALGADGFDAKGPHKAAAEDLAAELQGVEDPVIVWGERLWRSPGAVEALLAIAKTLGIDQRLGPGLLEIPESANGRGLREVGCSGDANAIRDSLASGDLNALILFDSNPVRDYPQSSDWEAALKKANFVVAVSMFDDESTKLANLVLPLESHVEKEGVVTHPDGRLQRVRRGIEVPDGLREGWRWLGELSKMLGDDLKLESQPETFAAVAAATPIYEGLTLDEIGGLGARWQERPQASNRVAPTGSTPAGPASAPPNGDGLILGTYRDIWADDVTERNPSLKFLKVEQRLEISKKDAEELDLQSGQHVTVSVNGDSVEAHVAVRERMPRGAAFLIEGTSEGNANVLANGQPRRVEVKAK
ncbi:MAG: NADH-quinone oxidoreductase subunit [Pseudonocardiales bacterium]|nr:NADH-quinone oxidoreductase subunit [Pseudonocardiales bacterium]